MWLLIRNVPFVQCAHTHFFCFLRIDRFWAILSPQGRLADSLNIPQSRDCFLVFVNPVKPREENYCVLFDLGFYIKPNRRDCRSAQNYQEVTCMSNKMPGLNKIIGHHQSLNSSKTEKSEKWHWPGWLKKRKPARSSNQLVPNVSNVVPREYEEGMPSHSQGGNNTILISYCKLCLIWAISITQA